jgi:hypothetical protein
MAGKARQAGKAASSRNRGGHARGECLLTCSTVDLDQYDVRRTVFISTLSTCGGAETITEPSLMRFHPLRRVKCRRTGNAAARAFAFQGRCFVVAAKRQIRHGGRKVLAILGIRSQSARHHKAPSCRQGAATQRREHESAPPEKTRVLGLPAGPLGPRYGQPVLIPHAPSRKRPAIYRGPERGQNPPAMFAGARGGSSSTLGRPTVVFRSASRPTGSGPASDRPLAGQCPLVKAPEAVSPQSGVGRFHGIGIARSEKGER